MKVILNETKLPLPSKDSDKEYSDVKLHHICEICGSEAWLTPEEGFAEGWCCLSDSHRESDISYKRFDELTDKQKQTVMRIYNELESILATDNKGGDEDAD